MINTRRTNPTPIPAPNAALSVPPLSFSVLDIFSCDSALCVSLAEGVDEDDDDDEEPFELSGVALLGVALSGVALLGVALSGVALSGVASSGVALSGVLL